VTLQLHVASSVRTPSLSRVADMKSPRSTLLFEGYLIRISAGLPAIVTESFRGFPLSLANVESTTWY